MSALGVLHRKVMVESAWSFLLLGTVRITLLSFTPVFCPSSSLSALLPQIIVQVGHGEGAGQTSVKMIVATLTVTRCHSNSSCIKTCHHTSQQT